MAHNHDHTPGNFNRAFAIGTVLNLIFVVVEAGYGGKAIGSPIKRPLYATRYTFSPCGYPKEADKRWTKQEITNNNAAELLNNI